MARSTANVRSSTSAAQPHHRLTGEIRALGHRPQGPFLCVWAVVARALVRYTIIGAREERRCTRRASMHLAYLRALGDLLCSWKNSMHFVNFGARSDHFPPENGFQVHRSLRSAPKIRECVGDRPPASGLMIQRHTGAPAPGRYTGAPATDKRTEPRQAQR